MISKLLPWLNKHFPPCDCISIYSCSLNKLLRHCWTFIHVSWDPYQHRQIWVIDSSTMLGSLWLLSFLLTRVSPLAPKTVYEQVSSFYTFPKISRALIIPFGSRNNCWLWEEKYSWSECGYEFLDPWASHSSCRFFRIIPTLEWRNLGFGAWGTDSL